ncbi:CDGSH iron-sulfur domain-containing protein [Marinovum sp.]|uniref:CDGSH iron-sulfur domain-containing protein n=1 Tax=Marinovum sp. TaxID=2024839 RepID=UPI002B266C03|nr:CDGSH iron-sulfur domain-containing protein [Marinovum sp.]
MPKPRTYDGAEIAISFDMSRCIHARNCFLKLPQVFDPTRRPWVDPDAAPAEEIAAMIRTCPSGALSYERRDGGRAETPPAINRVAVWENGPLAVAGDLQIGEDHLQRATLCRCGLSKTKPFCDHSHAEGGFRATGEPAEGEGAAEAPGPLQVTCRENGPLVLIGPAEVTTGTGRRVKQAGKLVLCRCGQSGNKPFCDGSHKAAEFTADPV